MIYTHSLRKGMRMSIITDAIYMSRLAPSLERCSRKSQYLWNFRCCVCGDSRKDKTKKRAYVYRKGDGLVFHCHNCHAPLGNFGKFLKHVNPSLYREYALETFKFQNKTQNKPELEFETDIQEKFEYKVNAIKLPTINDLGENHFCRQFVYRRKIPKQAWNELYFSDDFMGFIEETFPEYDRSQKDKFYQEPRLVIPIISEGGDLVGVQGRALLNSKNKYITIMANPDQTKIFGLDKINYNKRIYIVEGPLDSLFLENSVAVMDANLSKFSGMFMTATYISDNEPDNKDIRRVMRRIIDMDLDIFIWPSSILEKDINDLILAGYTASQIMSLIDQNTFSGLRAKLEYKRWENGK